MKKVILLSSTPRNNFKLAKKIEEILIEKDAKVEIIELESLKLPLYTPEVEKKEIPEKAYELSEKLQKVNGFVLVAPEYNGSLPPVLVNTLAWVSRTGGDWRASFNGKLALVASNSGGGGEKVCQAMKLQLEHLGAITFPRVIIENSSKSFKPESASKIVETFLSYLKDL